MGASAEVVMYATSWCPYCAAARSLLSGKGVTFREIDIDTDPRLRDEMIGRSRRRTVPQIFIGGHHIGGFDDLAALEQAGRLTEMLGSAGVR